MRMRRDLYLQLIFSHSSSALLAQLVEHSAVTRHLLSNMDTGYRKVYGEAQPGSLQASDYCLGRAVDRLLVFIICE